MRVDVVLSAVAAALVLLAGCGGGGEPQPASRTAYNGDVFNSADVRFASDMVVHHAQGLQLVGMLREHSASSELKALGERLLAEQPLQTEEMVTWLTDWDQEVPETPMDHVNADHHGEGGMQLSGDELPGLLSSEQVEELEQLTGTEFDRRWAELMVEHQRGALTMVETLEDQGAFEPARALAATIADQHAETIELLEDFA